MTHAPNQIAYLLHRRDPSKNMARFYRLDLREDLFGGIVLERIYGRIGTYGQQMDQYFTNENAAHAALQTLLSVKLRKGYKAVSCQDMSQS
jgi:predicted DNA-binding WGR domain protein